MYQHRMGTLPHLSKAYFVTHLDTHSYNRHKLNYRYEVARTNVRYFSAKIAGPKLWLVHIFVIHVLQQLLKMPINHSYWICTKCFC